MNGGSKFTSAHCVTQIQRKNSINFPTIHTLEKLGTNKNSASNFERKISIPRETLSSTGQGDLVSGRSRSFSDACPSQSRVNASLCGAV
jgi:hypothetical protein